MAAEDLNMAVLPKESEVILLCGGRGIRPSNYLSHIPKAMVMVGDKPLIWHIMRGFATFGFTNFVLALGEHGNLIRDYFINYTRYTDNFRIKLGSPELEALTFSQEVDWEITFVETGASAGTGARVSRCQKYIMSEHFMVAYSDCLSNVNLKHLWQHHKTSGKIATVTGVRPPFRYGEFVVERGEVTRYYESSVLVGSQGWINGGFMVFNREVFDYLTPFNECMLEREIFAKLVENKRMALYQHNGYWQYVDTDREIEEIDRLYKLNQRPWLAEPGD
jgi:glucose-1-phosphate cytidylyltransferase